MFTLDCPLSADVKIGSNVAVPVPLLIFLASVHRPPSITSNFSQHLFTLTMYGSVKGGGGGGDALLWFTHMTSVATSSAATSCACVVGDHRCSGCGFITSLCCCCNRSSSLGLGAVMALIYLGRLLFSLSKVYIFFLKCCYLQQAPLHNIFFMHTFAWLIF